MCKVDETFENKQNNKQLEQSKSDSTCSCTVMTEPQVCSISLNQLQLCPSNCLAFYENGSDLWDTKINWDGTADVTSKQWTL